jgi:hypothetical protein
LLYQANIERHSFYFAPKPFKDPSYVKNAQRRNKSVKQILAGERDRYAKPVKKPPLLPGGQKGRRGRPSNAAIAAAAAAAAEAGEVEEEEPAEPRKEDYLGCR